MTEYCSSGCPAPPEPPWLLSASWRIWELITWPLTIRALKRAGFRRTGWMTWESGPEDEDG
jgi:hypothetical protein